MFFYLGHVLHLNQDLASPAHVRNDNHIPHLSAHNFFEAYGAGHTTDRPAWFESRPRGWPSWRVAGFTQLKDFWDRDKYAGNFQELDSDALAGQPGGDPANQLGLAEFCNGNFLSEDSMYAECIQTGDRPKHYFPFPSRDHSTDFSDVWKSVLSGVGDFYLADGSLKRRLYLAKTRDGVAVAHHSAVGFNLTMKMTSSQSIVSSPSMTDPFIPDSNVLDDYHSILIPKAVEYSTGILDYFFRGQLNVAVSWDGADYHIRVANKSGQDFKAGAFTLLQEDASGNRTTVANVTWDFAQPIAIPSGTCIEGTLPGPMAEPTKFILVYKGTIGSSGGTALDPVDDGVAIAAKQFKLYPGGARLEELANDVVGQAPEQLDAMTSFGDQPAGRYAWNCVPGNDWTAPYSGGTARSTSLRRKQDSNDANRSYEWAGHWYSYVYFRENGQVAAEDRSFATYNPADVWSPPGYTGVNNGCVGCADESSAYIAAARNPCERFDHAGGPIGFWGAKTGLGAGLIDDIHNYYIGVPGELNAASRSGAPVFLLVRLSTFYPQPARVRIKDFAQLLPSVTMCANCQAAPGLPAWDGAFGGLDYEGLYIWYYATSSGLSINGKVFDNASTYIYFEEGWDDAPHFLMKIYSTDTSNTRVLLWSGKKYYGTNATGAYQRNPDSFDCATGDYDFCAKDLEQIEIEAD